MIVFAVAGGLLILLMLFDAFESVVLPRRVTRRWRLSRLVLRATWMLWSRPARHWRSPERREAYLSVFGPSALILWLGVWATGLVLGWALLYWGLESQMHGVGQEPSFAASLYASGTTFFTLGLGDVLPYTTSGRVLVVLQAGTGLAFLAVVIAYVPVLNEEFSHREVHVSLLDARAGSPPSAVELLRRHAGADQDEALSGLLKEWERWAAELLESQLSYPILAYYRSLHRRQSWLAALTLVLDVSSLVIVGTDATPPRAARMAFASARHATADLTHVLGVRPKRHGRERLPAADLARARWLLREAGIPLWEGHESDEQLATLRRLYEPFVEALSDELLMSLPRWLPTEGARDAWQTTLWELGEDEEVRDGLGARQLV